MDKNLIIDVGVHQGEDTEYYLKKGFRVVGIEANPQIYEATKNKLQSYIDNGQLQLLNVAIAPQDGEITFYTNLDKSIWGTTSSDFVVRNEILGTKSEAITVQGARFENILQDFGIPYYLKVDIEGSDILCVQALKHFDTKPQFISIESVKTSWSSLLEEFKLLKELGYQKFKVINQEKTAQQICPYPAREGKYIEHQFEFGASGLFGEETPGHWLSERAAINIYKRIFWFYKILGVQGIIYRYPLGRMLIETLNLKEPWYDTHASL
ncbi:FkbM family methyltransferase [Cylindrospermopsis raciborskii]|uniref:FkbM family methyltransferase n=2 Tax=Cylindrospermopsis raciborskii TaxID=77022 RepID=A0A9Q5QXS5_9CYAN|nr:FkbM family methyltransferase [Cylindrospermopsis raciborskii]OHY36456.1 FkbM family methyltransferase [Cylindrospermopsis raciborskii MVCC14]OPH10340.1 FkbM family methyltransferase [Cylindrospermopsis raciborskii CENA302]